MSWPDASMVTRSAGLLMAALARFRVGGMCLTAGSHMVGGGAGKAPPPVGLPPGELTVPAGRVVYPKKSTTPQMV